MWLVRFGGRERVKAQNRRDEMKGKGKGKGKEEQNGGFDFNTDLAIPRISIVK